MDELWVAVRADHWDTLMADQRAVDLVFAMVAHSVVKSAASLDTKRVVQMGALLAAWKDDSWVWVLK